MDNNTYSEQEAARRRDEVVRVMASTPPQPHTKKDHIRRQKMEEKAGTHRAADKVRDEREA